MINYKTILAALYRRAPNPPVFPKHVLSYNRKTTNETLLEFVGNLNTKSIDNAAGVIIMKGFSITVVPDDNNDFSCILRKNDLIIDIDSESFPIFSEIRKLPHNYRYLECLNYEKLFYLVKLLLRGENVKWLM